MSVPWGVERCRTQNDSLEFYLGRWQTFCAAGFCDRFVIPIDATLYEFQRIADNQVRITTQERPEIMAEMQSLKCSDASYDAFESVVDGFDLYLPDDRGFRAIAKHPEFQWNYQRAHSLSIISRLSANGSGLSAQLAKAGQFCQKYQMIVSVSY